MTRTYTTTRTTHVVASGSAKNVRRQHPAAITILGTKPGGMMLSLPQDLADEVINVARGLGIKIKYS